MIKYHPSLMISRLIVRSGEAVVYDEPYHAGVNIIRGMNSVGKTTIARFIFYILGGEDVVWVEEALRCDWVWAEILLNGAKVTLRRQISTQSRRPLCIFWGDYDAAQSTGISNWQEYPFSQIGTKQSFSQVLFRSLGIPEVKEEQASRLTMHQMLRLLYADQETAADEVFRSDRFDSHTIRESIGDLLLVLVPFDGLAESKPVI